MPDNNLYPHFSAVEFARRYAAVRTAMQTADLSTLIVSGTLSSYNEIAYLSNFLVTREAMLVFPLEGNPALFVQMYNHVPTARQMACISDVRWGGPDTSVAVAGIVLERGLSESRIGLVGAVSYKQYQTLRRLLPHATLVDFTPQFIQLRLIKSDEEIAFLRKGAEFSDLAMQALENEARPGIMEHQLTAIVEKSYLGLGGRTHIHYMATTSMRNPTVCVPAQHQSNRIIENGDALLTEISSHYHGYPGQILRPFAIGMPPTSQYQHMFAVASEAFHRIASVIRPGATIDDVLDAAAYIHTSGFTIYDDLLHGFGGGYLPPVLRTRQTSAQPPAPFIFQENMTLVIQPNIITADERMGVQVGELVLVTHDGIESLHHYPLRFVVCARTNL